MRIAGSSLRAATARHEVARQLFGVSPREVQLLVGHNDLASIPECLREGDVFGARKFSLGPPTGKGLVRPASKEKVSATPITASTVTAISSLK